MKLPSSRFSTSCLILATAVTLAACSEESPLAPAEQLAMQTQMAMSPTAAYNQTLATLRRVTARYHDIDTALADGFVLLHPCEERGDEEPVGAVYAHFGRVLDGVISAELPDALVYEPGANGKHKLVAVELAQPYAFAPQAPTFMGATFQEEDEFGVWALHVWVWRHNPEGMFAESNPRVSCGAEA
jgi:hypothetical protein